MSPATWHKDSLPQQAYSMMCTIREPILQIR